MDGIRDVPQVQHSYSGGLPDSDLIVAHDGWQVYDLVLTQEKIRWMWEQVLMHPALRAQYGRVGAEGFVEMLTRPDLMFFEVWKEGAMVPSGVVYFTNMTTLQDVEVHVFFYDSALTNKIGVSRKVLKWMFDQFHMHRISISIPRPFGATIRYTLKLGFKVEGVRREAVQLKGVYHDLMMFGLLRSSVDG